ncbi:alpha/beta hydrolase [Nocardioides sp. Kera G14]|uniref:alpha/beta hydrolase n=1 Tax=Nocardioides sp. Kera G14 TaxID=2884264 RepID=UPI001D1233A1|nr:alpha/beta fold hydrolase [Nocardioides sp. Kera G14]UDY22515.1 alpha/beta fold hydrolase [Nocardioides sp. Kera G14]
MTSTPPVLDSAQPLSLPARPELTGGVRIGVLVQHGFTGSPASMREWGQFLADQGYAVEVPRLPGHGTTWQDLNTKRWPDWYGEASRAFEKLAAENDKVVVAGLSMGGALVLRLAADHPQQVAGVVIVNPIMKTDRFDVKLLPVLKHVIPGLKGIGSDIKKEGVVEASYTHTPLKAIHSLFQALKLLRADLPKVTAPVLYLRSTIDHVVDGASEPAILSGISSTDVTVVRLENSFHVATMDHDAEQIHKESAAFIARVV